MADIFSVTAPITVKDLDTKNSCQGQKVVAEYFKHPKGLLYFDLFWHQSQPENSMHLLEGEITGEGPWRINNTVLNVLGCRSTNIEMAMQHEQWLTYLHAAGNDYPPEGLVLAIAKTMGADV